MPEMTIQLRTNPETGRKDIIIHMRSDEEALPHEHEQQHRALVEQLLGRGIVNEDDLGEIVVERADPVGADLPHEEKEDSTPQPESRSDNA